MAEIAVSTRTLEEAIDNWVSTLAPNLLTIVEMRFPSADTKQSTLQEVGDVLGVSRERVRQLETRLFEQIRKAGIVQQINQLSEVLREMGGCAEPFEVEARYPQFDGLGRHLWLLDALQNKGLLVELTIVESDRQVHLVGTGKAYWLGRLREAREAIQGLLAKGGPQEDIIVREVVSSYFASDMQALAALAFAFVLENALIARGQNLTSSVVSLDRNVDDVLFATLLELGRPSHYSKIFEHASERFDFKADVRTLHNACGRSQRLYLFGRGEFGLLEHHRLPHGKQLRLAREIEEIICLGDSARQWHAAELLEALLDSYTDIPRDFSACEVDVIVSAHCRDVVLLGRQVYQAKGSQAVARIDVRQAVTSILLDSGGPLGDKSIINRLKEYRGVSSYTGALLPTAEYARTSTGQIGLLQRDFGISRDTADDLVGSVEFCCRNLGHGIHLSEIRSFLGEFDTGHPDFGHGVLAYCRVSSTLKISVSNYVYPSEWSGPNRLSVAEAIRHIAMESGDEAWTLSEVIERVKHLTLRTSITNYELGTRLAGLDYAQFNTATRKWEFFRPQ